MEMRLDRRRGKTQSKYSPRLRKPTTLDERREQGRYAHLTEKARGKRWVKLPDFPRIADGQANLAWGKAMARDFVNAMISCRLQTQVPACYIAEKMGVASEIVYRLEGDPNRGIKLDTALRYLYALGLEVEIVEYPEGVRR